MKRYRLTNEAMSLCSEIEETLEHMDQAFNIGRDQILPILNSQSYRDRDPLRKTHKLLFHLLDGPDELYRYNIDDGRPESFSISRETLLEQMLEQDIDFLLDQKILERDVDEEVWDIIAICLEGSPWLNYPYFDLKKQDVMKSLHSADKEEIFRLGDNHRKVVISIVLLAMELTLDPETQN